MEKELVLAAPVVLPEEAAKVVEKEAQFQVVMELYRMQRCLVLEGDDPRLLALKEAADRKDVLLGGEAILAYTKALGLSVPVYSRLPLAEFLCLAENESQMHDLVDFAWDVIKRNQRAERLRKLNAPLIIMANELRALQSNVEYLMYNCVMQRQAVIKLGKGRERPMKCVSDLLGNVFHQDLPGVRALFLEHGFITRRHVEIWDRHLEQEQELQKQLEEIRLGN